MMMMMTVCERVKDNQLPKRRRRPPPYQTRVIMSGECCSTLSSASSALPSAAAVQPLSHSLYMTLISFQVISHLFLLIFSALLITSSFSSATSSNLMLTLLTALIAVTKNDCAVHLPETASATSTSASVASSSGEYKSAQVRVPFLFFPPFNRLIIKRQFKRQGYARRVRTDIRRRH